MDLPDEVVAVPLRHLRVGDVDHVAVDEEVDLEREAAGLEKEVQVLPGKLRQSAS